MFNDSMLNNNMAYSSPHVCFCADNRLIVDWRGDLNVYVFKEHTIRFFDNINDKINNEGFMITKFQVVKAGNPLSVIFVALFLER